MSFDPLARLSVPVLYTGPDGKARFREQAVALSEGSPAARLSSWMQASACRLRRSPVGFASDFHCTEQPQWLFVLQGVMEIGLRDGSARRFGPGMFFYSADTVPSGQHFDPERHGHRSRQLGPDELVTLFVQGPEPGSTAAP